MKNKEFFYQQYNKIDWENQEKTKINSFVNNFIIQNIILKKKSPDIKIFDIGFGIGFFYKMLQPFLLKNYKNILLEGCEPSEKNYKYFRTENLPKINKKIKLRIYNKSFQDLELNKKFDFVTAIYIFPHFLSEDLEKVTKKINSLLENKGKFILVVANERYLREKLKSKKDLFIEDNIIKFNEKNYREFLHYSNIPEIGRLVDYNREERFYIDLFEKKNFKIIQKKDLNDNGFICTVFVFEKTN